MIQPNLFDTPYRKPNPPSECRKEAREKVNAQKVRLKCLEVYEGLPDGATADEVAKILRDSGFAWADEFNVRPRVADLKREGFLMVTGEKRENRKGNSCAVLALKKYVKGE